MFGERKNAGRFELLEDLEMDRLQFSRQIRQKELGFTTNQLDHVFAFPGKKIFEVVLSLFVTDSVRKRRRVQPLRRYILHRFQREI